MLEALAEGPTDRASLRAETGASSPTVGGVLADFGARRWVGRDAKYVVEHIGTRPSTAVSRAGSPPVEAQL